MGLLSESSWEEILEEPSQALLLAFSKNTVSLSA